MSTEYQRLYEAGVNADEAFILESGEIVFYITTADHYSLCGKSIIVGATELFLISEGIFSPRLETALVVKNSRLKRISRDSFEKGLSSFPFLLNISIVLAKQLLLTNQILSRKQKAASGRTEERKTISVEYFHILRDISAEYAKRKLPWLKDFIIKYETSLVYKEGEALSKTMEPVKITGGTALTERIVEYPINSDLCIEGDEGHEMFILQSGSIDVIIGGKSVAMISEPGTPIGEIALLIGEKRSATLRAKNTVIAAKLEKKNLAEIAQKDISVIKQIALSLAKKQHQNISKIIDLSGKIFEKEINTSPETRSKEALKIGAMESELRALRGEFSDIVFKKKESFLKDIAQKYGIT